MDETNNPYQSPGAESSTISSLTDSGGINAKMKEYLKATSSWMRFLGVLLYIGVGFMALAGLLMMFGMSFMENLGAGASVGIAGGIVYLVLGVLLFFPAKYMHKGGSRLRDYVNTNQEEDLEQGLRNTKSLWKFYGVYAIVALAAMALGLVGALIAGMAARF